MNRKRVFLFILPCLVLSSLIFQNQSTTPTYAWGLATHQFMVDIAADYISTEWQEAFSYYGPEIVGGSTYPDQVLQDWDNHLYYPISQEHNAPWKVNETIDAIKNFANNEEWDNVFFFLGVVSHYTSDINIPVHTDLYWDGHPTYESDINSELDSLTVSVHDFGEITDPVQFIIDCATHAHQYYWDIRNAYPTGTETDVLSSNSTIRAETEEQLGRAIGAIIAIWEYTISELTPPVIEEVTDVAKVMVDKYHDNDYTTDNSLSGFVDTLDRDIVEVVFNEAEITTLALIDIDLLVITAIYNNATFFSATELEAIINWYHAGGHLIISSKSDFYYDINHEALNQLLESIGSDIRINDDSVYTTSADPEYYSDWYCNTNEYGTDPEISEIISTLNKKVQFYAPCSLYSQADSLDSHWLIYVERMFYQDDRNPPVIEVIYDDTNDNTGGTAIPLAGIEINNTASMAVFAATTWSDYDFALSDRDNKNLIWNVVEFLLDIDLEANNDIITSDTTISTETTTTETTTSPFTTMMILVSITALISLKSIRRRK